MSNFEEHINRKLNNHRSEVDTDLLWESIKDDIPKKKDKRRGIIFFFFLMGASVMGGLWMYSSEDINTDLLSNQVMIAEELPQQHTINNIVPVQKTDLQESINKQDDVISSNGVNNIAATSIPISKDYNAGHSSSLDINYNASHFNANKAVQTIESLVGTSSPSYEIIQIGPSKGQDIVNEDLKDELDYLPFMIGTVNMNLEQEELFAVNIVEEELEDEELEEKEEETSNEKKLTVLVGFHNSYGNTRSIINPRNSDAQSYAQERIDSENPTGTFEMGLDVMFKLKSGFTFRTGLAHSRISEKYYYSLQPTSVSNNNSNIDQVAHLLAIGDHDLLIENDKQTRHDIAEGGKSSSQIKNVYSMTDIPLVLGYEMNLSRKFFIGVEAGTYLNIHSNAEGKILSPYGRTIRLESSVIKPYKKNILASTYTGISMNYQLKPNMSIKLGGHFRYTPFSITSKNYDLEQRYSSVGVNMGMLFTIK